MLKKNAETKKRVFSENWKNQPNQNSKQWIEWIDQVGGQAPPPYWSVEAAGAAIVLDDVTGGAAQEYGRGEGQAGAGAGDAEVRGDARLFFFFFLLI